MSYGQNNSTLLRSPCNGKSFKCVDARHYRQCRVIAKVDNQTMSALDSKVKACGPGRMCNAKNKSPCVLRTSIKQPSTSMNKPMKNPNKGSSNNMKPILNSNKRENQTMIAQKDPKPGSMVPGMPANGIQIGNLSMPVKDAENEIDSDLNRVPIANTNNSSSLSGKVD